MPDYAYMYTPVPFDQKATRLHAWMWFFLRSKGIRLTSDIFGTSAMWQEMYTKYPIYFNSLVETSSKQNFLLPEKLDWITEGTRQNNWLLSYMREEFDWTLVTIPQRISRRDLTIAHIDIQRLDLYDKEKFVTQIRQAWNSQIKADAIFKWFKKEEEVSRCEFAWRFILGQEGGKVSHLEQFKCIDDLLTYFDQVTVTDAHKKYEINAIKNGWRLQQSREKPTGKKQCNVLLSQSAMASLDAFAKKYGASKARVIESLIEKEVEKKLYLPQKKDEASFDEKLRRIL